MPSQRQSRRRKDVDDEPLHPRVEESHSDPYSRLSTTFRQSSNYRGDSTSNSSRASYDMSREASSSRTHRDSNWRSKDAEHRYNYGPSDDYYRDGRDEYDVTKLREPEAWSTHSVPDPRYPERDWSQRYDQGYSTPPSYPEGSSWSMSSHAPLDHQKGQHERWQPQDNRGHTYEGRVPERAQDVEKKRDWSRDQRRGKDNQKWASGSGWDSARRENRGNAWVDPSPRWKPPPEKKPPVDNRAWEPAPTWQPSVPDGEHQHHRNHSGTRSDYYKKSSPGGRRAPSSSSGTTRDYTNNKPQRDWRNDDGNPNNWSRRESHMSEKTMGASPPPPRKHLRSPSRSRSGSRSPAESYYSRRSSRGRTRSPSVSPASKRRRRDPSPIVVAGRASHEGGHAAWVPRQDKPLPQSSESRRKQGSLFIHKRSASPASSMSTGRSLSRTPPPEISRSLHRLSSAVSAPAIVSLPRGDTENVSRDFVPRQNGISPANGGGHNKRGSRTQPLTQSASADIMPPPTIIPAPHSTRIQPEFSPSFQKMEMGPTRLAVKTPAFKPIGQSSSSLKKFFPGDEEDTDISSDMSGIADPDLQGHPSQLFTNRPLELHTRPDHPNLPVPSLLTRSVEDNSVDAPSHPRPPSSPLGPSRDSSVTEDLPLLDNILNDETQPRRPSSPALQTPKPPDFEPNDNTGVLTPSNRTRSELYAIVSQVGEGTFGKVYKAQNTVTKLHVALKRIRMESEKEGFPVTAMREIKLLQSLRHENVVRLYEMMVSNGSVYMVFEYMDHDLTGILSQTQFSFTDAHLKSLSHQMLAGLAYLHHKGVIHRDIKGSNILINNRGELKLGDFGLARFYQKRRRTDYTNRVITLWYRPPELLFGATVYGPEVDMWSAGCIMLELFTKKPVFQGNDEIHQLDTIYRVIGTPTTDRWSGVVDLPWYELVKPRDEIPNHFREMFRKWMSPAALDLAERLLCYDPAARATALQAMEAPYFTQEEPPAMAPVGLHGEWHELETKRERAKKRRRTETAMQ